MLKLSADGKIYHQHYEKGVTASKLTTIGKTKSSGDKGHFSPG